MNGSYLLDTNIVIGLFADDINIIAQLSTPCRIFIPSIVLGELYFGAAKSVHSKANSARIDAFALKSTVLVCDAETARYYGRIKNFLRTKGSPVPENVDSCSCQATPSHPGYPGSAFPPH